MGTDLSEAQYRLIEASGHVAEASRALLTWLHNGSWHPNRCRCCVQDVQDWADHDSTLPCGQLAVALEQLGPAVRAVTTEVE